jgi:ubiquinone/menaquinone biosynthesis C-methylase UbiE
MATGTDEVIAQVRANFEAFDGEWDRLRKDVAGRVSFEIHRQFLDEHLTPGARVLEVGAGPGAFTQHLARAGARVTVTDLSPAQLAQNRQRTTEAGLADAVTEWQVADIRDLSGFADGAFDLTLAYGGPLSYVFEDAPIAVAELLRVTRRGGVVLASVMSTLGAYRYYIRGVVDDIARHGSDAITAVLRTGDLRPTQPTGHVCQMYRSDQVPPLVAQAGGEVIAMSASNWAALGDADALARLEAYPAAWTRFLDDEIWACRQPGALDGGTHILFAARRGGRAADIGAAEPSAQERR